MPITDHTIISDLLVQFPQTRHVFDRYGLKGCGGQNGPAESLRFFARAHGVDLTLLLAELNESIALSENEIKPPTPDVGDSIYRRFFLAGILSTVTAGALWGAILLIQIGLKGKFTAISIFDINAHGHAQIFGWVGLFVMGFAYQAFPRFKHTSLWNPEMAVVSFILMLAGLILRVVAEPLHMLPPMVWVGVGAGILELAAIGIFITIIGKTIQGSGKPLEPYDYYITAALFWFFAQGALDVFHLYMMATASSRDDLLHQVATWQAALRDMQIHGFATTMILGVSQRFLFGIFGFPQLSKRRSLLALGVLQLGILCETVFFVLFRVTNQHWYAALMYTGMILITAAILGLTKPWWTHFWGSPQNLNHDVIEDRLDRSFKFLRFAYAWLLISMAMLLLMPFYNLATKQPFSHAYYGATRHAITVGFISLMIVGVASKVVPVLNGISTHQLSRLTVPFVLLNVGCVLRVGIQILTDLVPSIFPVIGVSGVLEVTGLAIWGFGLWKVMRTGKRAVESSRKPLAKPTRISAEDKVGLILEAAPELQPIFIQFGFAEITNPILLRTVARQTSFRQACSIRGVDLNRFLDALNGALNPVSTHRLISLTVLNSETQKSCPKGDHPLQAEHEELIQKG